MSDTPWTSLRAPFPASAVTWDPTDLGESGDEALMCPRLSRSAICSRLDEVIGAPGWSISLLPTEGGIVCTLRVGEVTKSAAADHRRVGPPSAERTAGAALAGAAELLGMRAPVEGARWAPFDTESGAVLEDALAAPDLAHAAPSGRPSPAAVEADPLDVGHDMLRDAAEARGLTAEGQQMIDRLVERLKAEGQGLSAARLLVRHGGYGKDPAAARELYAQLRALLIRVGEHVESSP